jgi:flagellar biosynthesis GTPase FlhF
MRTSIVSALLSAALATGCHANGQVQYSAEADVTPPQLVVVSPGVQVVADYDQPVFYSENFYWRFDNGVWYRSQYHTRGWVRVETVPVAVRRIDRPARFVHYRADASAEAHGEKAAQRRDEKAMHEEQKAERKEEKAEIKAEVKAEHREEAAAHKEEKAERKEEKAERKEVKAERKEEKAERKEEKKEHKK